MAEKRWADRVEDGALVHSSRVEDITQIAVGLLDDKLVWLWPGHGLPLLYRPDQGDSGSRPPPSPERNHAPAAHSLDDRSDNASSCSSDGASSDASSDDAWATDPLLVAMVFENQPTIYAVQLGYLFYGTYHSALNTALVMQVSPHGEASENGHGSIWMVSASEASRTDSKASRAHYGLAEWRNNWPSFTAARVLDAIDPEDMGTQVLAFRDLTTEPFELREVHVVDGQLQTTKS